MRTFVYHKAHILSLIWAAIIFVLCATPGQYIPSNDWFDLLSIDKLVHALMFFVLSSLFIVAAKKSNWGITAIIVLIILAILYGAFIELLQQRVFTNRSADWKDIVANSAGCVCAFLMLRKTTAFFLGVNADPEKK
jgi:VanZ family protein